MSVDSRRSPRLADYLPLEVYLLQDSNEHPLAGPFSGRILDFSSHGACLLMSQVMCNNLHVFHATQESDARVLQLRICLPPDLEQCLINARPVWFDLFRCGEIRAFKMGVEFIADPDKDNMRELQAALRKGQPQRARWWQAHGLRCTNDEQAI